MNKFLFTVNCHSRDVPIFLPVMPSLHALLDADIAPGETLAIGREVVPIFFT